MKILSLIFFNIKGKLKYFISLIFHSRRGETFKI